MRGGVAVGFRAVAGAGEDGAAGGEDDGADGNLVAGGGFAGLLQGDVHWGADRWLLAGHCDCIACAARDAGVAQG